MTTEFQFTVPPPRPRPIVLRPGADREERAALTALQRQQMALKVEEAVIYLAQLSVARLGEICVHSGLEFTERVEDIMDDADTRLHRYRRRFERSFSNLAMARTYHGLLELQQHATDTIILIASGCPTYQELPAEKQGLVRRALSALFG